MVARIVFTVPDEFADAMESRAQAFYLDASGMVRLTRNGEQIGNWMRIAPGVVTRYKKGSE